MTEQEEKLYEILQSMRYAIDNVLDRVVSLGEGLNQSVYIHDIKRDFKDIDKKIDDLYWMYRKDE
jgi:hypothetical protein